MNITETRWTDLPAGFCYEVSDESVQIKLGEKGVGGGVRLCGRRSSMLPNSFTNPAKVGREVDYEFLPPEFLE